MAERLSDENIEFLRTALDGVSAPGDELAIDILRQGLEVVSGQRDWVQLPSGRSFRLNANPNTDVLSVLPEGQRVVIEIRNPALDDWARHQGIRGYSTNE